MYVEQMYKKTQENVGKHKALGRRQELTYKNVKHEITAMEKIWQYSRKRQIDQQT